MSRDRNEADVTLGAGVLLMELADNTKTSKLTLGTRVGLQASSIHTSQGRELVGSLREQLLVAPDAAVRRVGVDVGNLLITDELHLVGTVQLHGARSQRNHGVDQRQILGLEVVHVSEHLSLAVVGVENWVSQELGLAANRLREAVEDVLGALLVTLLPELGSSLNINVGLVLGGNSLEGLDNADECLHVECGRNSQDNLAVGPSLTGTDALLVQLTAESLADNGVGEANCNRIGENAAFGVDRGSDNVQAVVLSCRLDHASVAEVADGHFTELLRSVVDCVHGRHVGEKSLGSADVAGSLLTSNVLLTSLKSETQGTTAVAVLGDTNNATRQTTLASFLHSHESGVRTTITKRNTPSLRVTKGNIGTPLSRGSEKSKSRDVSGSTQQRFLAVSEIRKSLEVLDTTVSVGVLNHDSEQVVSKSLDGVVSIRSVEI